MKYLEGLNDAQKQAVTLIEGPVSVLAGAGAGKTRVLATRIYHLIREGVPPSKILAVTFTNKAAREMRERVRALLGADALANDLPFIATFHGLGRELLESYGKTIGIGRFFSIYDRDDSEKAVAKALKELGVETKELSPRMVLGRISKAKGAGVSLAEFTEKQGRASFGARTTAEVWQKYEGTLRADKALDFDDLISLPVRLLVEHEAVRTQAQERWSFVHIDEYQDTNELQERLAGLLVEKHHNLFVVGDGDQCLVQGTQILLSDGTQCSIEKIKKGTVVLSNYGSGDMRPACVTRVFSKKVTGNLIQITTRSGSIVTSTLEHIHFAGYRLGLTPQLFFTYLMHKKGKGWRLGVSQTYTRGQKATMIGFQQRCNQEHGDAVWVIGTHNRPNEARVMEYQLSLLYAIPTLPFIARKGSLNGYVHDQETLDHIFRSLNTDIGAARLLKETGLSIDNPHHRAQATLGTRRNIVIAFCGERRGKTPMHRISMVGRDALGREALETAGFSVRAAKKGSVSWRFETVYKGYANAMYVVEELQAVFPDARIVQTARLGGKKQRPRDGNSLPFLPAESVRQGMALFDKEGGWDIVEKIERIRVENKFVYDLDIEHAHNFVANGILTHNSIYGWRGAKMENILNFDKKYPDAKTIVLEHNYRSTKTIVEAANKVISENKNRKEKRSVTDNAVGARIVVHAATNAEDEARWVAKKIRSLMQEGAPPESIAILFRTNFQSRALEEGLLHAGVPYRLLGTRFFDRKEVKDVLAWVRLALEPSRETDKMRAAQSPPRGIGKTTLGKLAAGARDTLRAGERAKVEQFEALVESLHVASENALPSEFVRLVIEKSGVKTALAEGSEDERERFENVQELATLASRHNINPGQEGIAAFLAEAALASDQDEMDRSEEKKGVTLMTVHAAKGLEFDTVFVTGMEEGLFPHEGMGNGEERDEEEERRLFYVAMTRARERLILTLARVRKIYGTDFLSEPSSFLSDIDNSLVIYDETSGEDVIEA